MALYAFDGTGNEDQKNDDKDSHVVRLRDAYLDGNVVYKAGVGTRFGLIGKLLGGVGGAGGHKRIREMMEELENTYSIDAVVDIIGYSRGAAMAVHFANELKQKGVKVRFLGLFDVVASFGKPGNEKNLNYIVDEISDNVAYCAHAMAYDERRHNFLLSRQKRLSHETTLIETWFRGVHSDIGGTAIINETDQSEKGRTHISLKWMAEQAEIAGLSLAPSLIVSADAQIDTLSKINVNKDPKREPRDHTRTPQADDHFHSSAKISELEQGETRAVRCFSRVKFNPTGIILRKSQQYQFTVDVHQVWSDKEINCNADGWDSEDETDGLVTFGLELAEDKRRIPEENWFKLIGSIEDVDDPVKTPINKRSTFTIGTKLEGFSPTKSGELYTYANDLRTFGLVDLYTNNSGWVDINITRIS